jgi:hypothetical protein
VCSHQYNGVSFFGHTYTQPSLLSSVKPPT